MEQARFTDLLAHIVDNRGKTCPTSNAGTPLIATNCVKNSGIYPTFEKVRFVSKATHASWFRGHPKPGDLVFVTKGAPGQVCLVPDPVPFCIAQDMVALRADSRKVYPPYLFAALRSDQVQFAISNMHVGTMIPHFKKGDFDKLLVPLPDQKTQRWIGDMYLELSQKIELNRRTNDSLEDVARALFKDWFVDFGPVRAKMEGRTPYIATEIWTHFPDQLDERGRPKGWPDRRIDDIMELAYGKALTASERIEGSVPVYGSGGIAGFHNEAIANGPSVIIGRKGTVGSLFWEDRPFFPIDTVFFVNAAAPLTYCYYLLQTLGLEGMNTDAAVPGLNRKNVYRLIVPWPGESIVAQFDVMARSLRAQIMRLNDESSTLAATRDFLLAKLISGDVNFKDVSLKAEE